ncbi:NlpC/P60 family protein [Isoptericola jiangsuensis]|uniref:NlpC/P60 family protein n=1 Tax=Isoptericola jiangsuensis TaxID=548579 RepID=A0A2A9EU43_9MICO|nr:C40 family peptidase [Isoptericola jiangsuensis]PFG41782.1 NlpC/P60 family protein [Isoptericola jiangsuensis]
MTDALVGAPTRVAPAHHSRLRRAAVAMSLTAALAGGTLVAGAGTASAATTSGTKALGGTVVAASQAHPRVSITVSRKTGTKGKQNTRPVYTVKATRGGTAVPGRVKVFIDGKKVAVKKLNNNGVVRFRPTWGKYDVGRNKVRIVTDAAARTGLADVTKYRTVNVKPKQTSGTKVVKVANSYVGTRYTYGGSSPRTGFDCSGFTSYVYKKATGKTLPRSSSAQRSVGKKVSRAAARPGDLVYTPGHVAIYAGKGRVIEAGNPRTGVIKRSMWQSSPVFIRV